MCQKNLYSFEDIQKQLEDYYGMLTDEKSMELKSRHTGLHIARTSGLNVTSAKLICQLTLYELNQIYRRVENEKKRRMEQRGSSLVPPSFPRTRGPFVEVVPNTIYVKALKGKYPLSQLKFYCKRFDNKKELLLLTTVQLQWICRQFLRWPSTCLDRLSELAPLLLICLYWTRDLICLTRLPVLPLKPRKVLPTTATATVAKKNSTSRKKSMRKKSKKKSTKKLTQEQLEHDLQKVFL